MNDLEKRFPRYSKILGLYPNSYKKEYGQQIMQTTADMLDHAKTDRQKIAIWSKVALDLPLNISKQQLQLVGGTYMKETPNYIKIMGILTGVLVLPFFAAIIANGLDKLLNNHTLYNSWVWRYDYIRLWVLVLPAIAATLAIFSLLYYVIHSPTKSSGNKFKLVFDLKHNWPIMASGLIALGILFFLRFHDSAPCWIQQIPRHYLSHQNQGQVCHSYNYVPNGPMPIPPAH